MFTTGPSVLLSGAVRTVMVTAHFWYTEHGHICCLLESVLGVLVASIEQTRKKIGRLIYFSRVAQLTRSRAKILNQISLL